MSQSSVTLKASDRPQRSLCPQSRRSQSCSLCWATLCLANSGLGLSTFLSNPPLPHQRPSESVEIIRPQSAPRLGGQLTECWVRSGGCATWPRRGRDVPLDEEDNLPGTRPARSHCLLQSLGHSDAQQLALNSNFIPNFFTHT